MGDVIQHYFYFGERAKSMEKSNTREEILEAALDLFAVNGYEATSISQLADAVGIRRHPFTATSPISRIFWILLSKPY